LFYVTVWAGDWDALSSKTKLALISEIMCGIPKDDTEGKILPFDTKGFGTMYRTFKTIDYLEDPNIPDILEEDVEWIMLGKNESEDSVKTVEDNTKVAEDNVKITEEN
jgi:hypothetical protein